MSKLDPAAVMASHSGKILRQDVGRGEGLDFHQAMSSGNRLRELKSESFHLSFWETPIYVSILERFLSGQHAHLRDNIVVDLGCGDGRFVEWLLDNGYQRIVAVDADIRALENLLVLLDEREGHERVMLVQANAETVQLPPGSAQLVLAIGVLYYLGSGHMDGLRNTSDLLAPGGLLVASDPDLEGAALKGLLFAGPEEFLRVMQTRTFEEITGDTVERFPAYTEEDMLAMLDATGFHHLSSSGIPIEPSIVSIGYKRGWYDEGELAAVSEELRMAFSAVADVSCTAKHVVRLARKGVG